MRRLNNIAVVGIAHKLPQDVEDDGSFWEILQGAKNLSSEWPRERMNADAHPDPRNGESTSRGGHFVSDDPAGFDAPFFNLTAKEAATMDPVQRWTLEVSYRAFENAGIPSETLKGSRTAVLSATFTEDYIRMAAMDPDNVERTAATGHLASVIPNRVSYFFGMQGPSIHVDTACSSGLSAFDMACKILQTGDAEAALVTAANLILEPGMYQMFRNLQMLSPDSTCKAFDHKANGFGRGEGVLAFVLKPLSSALDDGDMIRAVIRAVASNQDGHTPALSQPNPMAQEELIRHAYAQADLPLGKTRYVESHGTGTPVGDPIEMKAIGNAFRRTRSAHAPLYVGSVKSNIGHLEGASGLAGILKAILVLEKGIIPPNALFEKLNPDIDAEFLHVEVPNRCIPWPSTGMRRVSVNGFGFGGSNTHIILDDALHFLAEHGLVGNHCTTAFPLAVNGTGTPGVNGTPLLNGAEDQLSQPSRDTGTHPKLLVFSALDEKAIKRTIQGYSTWYKANSLLLTAAKLDALAYTLSFRRTHMRWRSFAVSNFSQSEPEKQVAMRFSPAKCVRVVTDPALGWVFTGQGAQYVDMGKELVNMYPVFEETLRRVDEVYQGLGCSWSIFDQLGREDNINKPEYSQPLSTAIQLGLVDLLWSFGIFPRVVVGHSSGEIAAAYAIGALSLTSACKISYFRGFVAGKLRRDRVRSPGSMISVGLAQDQVTDFLARIQTFRTDDINIACINSPSNVTLSGSETCIEQIEIQAGKEGVFAKQLKTGVAYHSSAMMAVANEYLDLMGNLEPGKLRPPIPMISTVVGKRVCPVELADGRYWVDNMISPVKFAGAIQLLASDSDLRLTDLVEIGPHPTLRRYVQDILGKEMMQYSSALYRGYSAAEKTVELAGTLFCRGHRISLLAVNQQQGLDKKKAQPFLVNCPPYPFDHSHKLWAENRISRDYRRRPPMKGGTLGHRVSDWNPLQPRWRTFLSVETHPWVGHHVVDDAVLFPAAGMLIMALEATQEMVSADKTITGYFIRDAHFLSPVVVPESWDDRVELMLSLQPPNSDGSGNTYAPTCPSFCSDIRLFVYAKELHRWTEVFRASIQTQSEFNDGRRSEGDRMIHDIVRARYRQALSDCTLTVDPQLLYGDAAEYGLRYGEWFQLCQNIYWDKSRGLAVASVSASKPEKLKTQSFVHPTVLDTAFHVLRVSSGQQHAANVPVRLADAWISSRGWQAPTTSRVNWVASSPVRRKRTAQGEKGSVSALAEDGTVLATIETMVTAPVSKEEDPESLLGSAEETSPNEQKKLLYNVEWKPQLSMLSSENMSQACRADTFLLDGETMVAQHRKRTAILNIVAARHVRDLAEEQRTNLDETLRHHMDWMEHHVQSLPAAEREAAEALTHGAFEAQLDSFSADFPSWTLYPHVARSLPAIIAGELDPLQVIFESDHAKTFYSSLFHTVCGDGRLSRFLDLAAHEAPSLRILEVGAGTGGMTVHILNALKKREQRIGALAFSEYMYTDVSPVFFESAQGRWDAEGFGNRMRFKTLDMERSPSDQGFVESSYDLIVAGSCVHATKQLSKTLQNLRRALKTGGKLILLEVTDPTDIATCFFATLASGWWLSEEPWRVRNKSPLASEDAWDTVLAENGFSGNDLVLRDTDQAEAHIVSVIVSTAVENSRGTREMENTHIESGTLARRVLVVDDPQDNRNSDSEMELSKMLSVSTEDIILPLSNVESTSITSNDMVISIAEVDGPLLADISETQFIQLKSLVKRARNLIWVTAPDNGANDTRLPYYALAQGFLRTIRSEMPDSRIVSLAIEDKCSIELRAGFINTIVATSFESSPASADVDYIVRSGQIHTARAVEDVSGNVAVRSLLSPRFQQLAWKETQAVKLALGTPGSVESIRFEKDEEHGSHLGRYDIEIEAQAWGLTPRDALIALGRFDDGYDPDDDFGVVCAGVVNRVGLDCDPVGLRPGDQVVMYSPGCVRKYPRAPENCVMKLTSLNLETAIAALGPALNAYHALLGVARLQEGERVLIHGAASATGQLAVQLAIMKGAVVFATTTSAGISKVEAEDMEKENKLLVDDLGIKPEHIFCAGGDSMSFDLGVKSATQGYGVDVVVNTLGASHAYAGWQLLARGGRLVNIGYDDESTAISGLLITGSSKRNKSFSTIDIVDLGTREKAGLLRSTMALFEEGKLTAPSGVPSFAINEAKEAFRALQTDGKGSQHVVLTVSGPDAVVPQLIYDHRTHAPCQFHQDASYLVPGGFGGVGRSILAWMAARGARHLIVPSRSGPSSPAAAKLVSALQSLGVHIATPQCDVADENELAALVRDGSTQNMPSIRGVINCAMVLTSAVFTNMSFHQWSSAIRAKVDASSNLHRFLSPPEHKPLDFFVHLASLAGVNGQMASANYAAGCTFQDALARNSTGVTSLDVGWMADVGLIAETAAFQRQLQNWGNMQRVEEPELLAVLDMVCAGSLTPVNGAREEGEQQAQRMVGLLTPADYLLSGKETPPALRDRPFLSTFSQPIHVGSGKKRSDKNGAISSGKVKTDPAALFRDASDDKARAQVVTDALAEKLARGMMMSAEEVDTDNSLSAYGMDSLMAMELRSWIAREFGARLGMWELLSREKLIKGIAAEVVRKSSLK